MKGEDWFNPSRRVRDSRGYMPFSWNVDGAFVGFQARPTSSFWNMGVRACRGNSVCPSALDQREASARMIVLQASRSASPGRKREQVARRVSAKERSYACALASI